MSSAPRLTLQSPPDELLQNQSSKDNKHATDSLLADLN